MYYLYKHTRLDKNEVFYIGIGTMNKKGKTFKSTFSRAFQKVKSRNDHWKNIIKKTKYKVEILFITNTQKEIIKKEIELIKHFKKTLCNQTDGGKGITSYNHTNSTKKRISKTMKGRKCSESHIINMNKRKFKPVRMISVKDNTEKVFDSMKSAANYIGKPQSNIGKCANGKRKTAYGYKFEIIESKNKES